MIFNNDGIQGIVSLISISLYVNTMQSTVYTTFQQSFIDHSIADDQNIVTNLAQWVVAHSQPRDGQHLRTC